MLPAYLRHENFETIRRGVFRIEIITGSCEDYFVSRERDSIAAFNFSNIFEWLSESDFEGLLKETIRVAKDGAIMTYRNLLVPRKHPDSLNGAIRSLEKLSQKLKTKDLSFIYNNYVIEKIKKERLAWITRSESSPTVKNLKTS